MSALPVALDAAACHTVLRAEPVSVPAGDTSASRR